MRGKIELPISCIHLPMQGMGTKLHAEAGRHRLEEFSCVQLSTHPVNTSDLCLSLWDVSETPHAFLPDAGQKQTPSWTHWEFMKLREAYV